MTSISYAFFFTLCVCALLKCSVCVMCVYDGTIIVDLIDIIDVIRLNNFSCLFYVLYGAKRYCRLFIFVFFCVCVFFDRFSFVSLFSVCVYGQKTKKGQQEKGIDCKK